MSEDNLKKIVGKDGKPLSRREAFDYKKETFSKVLVKDLTTTSAGRKVLKSYTQSEIREILEGHATRVNQDKLVEISRTLYGTSAQYRRLIAHFSGMPLYSYIITAVKDIQAPSDLKKVTENYAEIATMMKKMKLRSEFNKISRVALIQDVYFGYVLEDAKSFHIQEIPYGLCQISSIEDGVYNYAIDMSYFDGNVGELDYYPAEFTRLFYQWKIDSANDRTISDYVEIDSKNSLCLKFNDETTNVMPFFAGVFDSIFDVDGFKKLRKTKEEIDNYMSLIQTLPVRMDTDTNNDFVIDTDMLEYFHNMLVDSVPDEVGVATTPMKVEAIKFNKTKVGDDGVAAAERDLWNATGVSSLLFNSDGKSAQGLLNSIKTDEELVFAFLRQVERWINKRIKRVIKKSFFEVSILDVTVFNRQEMFKMQQEGATYGFATKLATSAILGQEPIETMNQMYLENVVLGMPDAMIPLQSSHTMSSDSVAVDEKKASGGQEKDDEELSDEGVKSRDKSDDKKS